MVMTSEPRVRRSDASRAAILDAARRHFAAHGYERATIRAIAKDAGIDASLVMRYYGNKELLFAAASDLRLELPDLRDVALQDVGGLLVAHFLERWERDESLVALLRAGVTHDAVADRLQNLFAAQLAPVVARFCPRETTAERTALTVTQMLGLALCRYILRIEPVAGMTSDQVVAWLGPTVQRYLTATSPVQP